jgi:hypothetical protein
LKWPAQRLTHGVATYNKNTQLFDFFKPKPSHNKNKHPPPKVGAFKTVSRLKTAYSKDYLTTYRWSPMIQLSSKFYSI